MRSCPSDSRAGCCVSLFCPGVSAARGSPSFWQAVPSGWQFVLPPVGTSCSDSPGAKRPDWQHLLTFPCRGRSSSSLPQWRALGPAGEDSEPAGGIAEALPSLRQSMNTVKRNWRKKPPDVFRQTVAGDASRAPRSCRPSPALREPRRLAFWLFQQRRGQRGSLRKPRHPPSLRLLYLPLHRTRLFSFLSLKSCLERLALTLTAASLPRTPLPFFSVPDVTRKGTDPGTGGTATLCRGTLFCLETCAAAFHLTNKISLCVSLSAGSNLSPPRSS